MTYNKNKKLFLLNIQSFVFLLIYFFTAVIFFNQEGYILKTIIFIFALFGIFLYFLDNKLKKREIIFFALLLLLIEFMGLSYIYNENYIRYFGEINTFILYIYLFLVVVNLNLSIKISYLINTFLLFFSVLPVIFLLFGFIEVDKVYGFTGFSEHRNHYALLSGLFLLIVVHHYNTRVKYILLSLLLIGLWLSGSRGTWIGVIGSLWFYINFKSKLTIKRIVSNILILIIVFLIYELYMIYMYGVQPHGDSNRILLLKLFFESIKDNFFFGVGRNLYFEMEVFENNVYAHNFIIQILANYGFIVFVSFILLLWSIFKMLSKKGASLLIYILIVGLFQPLFDVRFNPFYLLSLLTIVYYEKNIKVYR